MKKQIAFLLFLSLCVGIFASCGGKGLTHSWRKSDSTAVNCVDTEGASGYTSEYDLLFGVRYYTLTVEDGASYLLTVEIEGDAGNVSVSVLKDGETLHEDTAMNNCAVSYSLTAGTYVVEIFADEHEGKYVLTWEKADR